VRKYWEFNSIIVLLIISSLFIELNLGQLDRSRKVASLYKRMGGCNQHINFFLKPYEDLDEFTVKDLKKLKNKENLDSRFLMRFHQRLKAVSWQYKLNVNELERLKAFPAYKSNPALTTRINQLEIENAAILKEFENEARLDQFLAKSDELFNTYYNGKLEKDELLSHFNEEQLEALLRFFPLDPTKGQKVRAQIISNFFTVAPLILVPLASVAFDGGLTAGLLAGLKLSAGMKGLDIALDLFMNNMTKVVSPQKLVLLTAATTNVPELGASQVSAVIGDPLAEVASTPLGSNPANFLLAGFALFTSLKSQAVTKGIIRSHEKFGPKAIWKTIKSIDRVALRKHLGIAGIFAIDALAFQYIVKPSLEKGNVLPLAAWMTVNIPLLFRYFTKGAREAQLEMGKSIANFKENGAKQIESLLLQNKFEFEETSKELLATVASLKKIKAKRKIKPSEVEKHFKKLKTKFENSETFRLEIERAMHFIDNKDLYVFLKMGGLTDDAVKKLSKKEKIKIVSGIVAGFAAIIGFSVLLDDGVSDLSEAIPGMDKSAGGFFILSFFSSLGEFLVTKKFFSVGNYNAGAENIAYSNAINMMLAKMALATSFFKHHLFTDEDGEPISAIDSSEEPSN